MRGLRVITIALLGMPLVALLCGCDNFEDETTPEGQVPAGSVANSQETPSGQVESPAHTENTQFADMLALWDSGKKDDAVRQFVSIRWDAPDVFADLPVLNLSEDRFMSLPAAEKTSMQEEMMKLGSTFRAIARHACSVGDNKQASGDKEAAKAYYEAVRHFGEVLSKTECPLMLQLNGKAIKRGVQHWSTVK